MNDPHISITPQTHAIGAEIGGVDLAAPLSCNTLDEIRRAFADHSVIYFRDQTLTVDQHLDFARHFGEPEVPEKLPQYSSTYPTVSLIDNDGSKIVVGNRWHSDNTNYVEPPLGALMYAEQVPAVGGDTAFASMYAAYEALSDRMQHILSGLTGLHDNRRVRSQYAGHQALVNQGLEVEDVPVEHPIVRTHPVTGRKALFVNSVYTVGIKELSAPEGDALLKMLFEHLKKPEFAFRLHWSVGTLVFWDNRCVQHYAYADYNERRRMRRVVLLGNRPY